MSDALEAQPLMFTNILSLKLKRFTVDKHQGTMSKLRVEKVVYIM